MRVEAAQRLLHDLRDDGDDDDSDVPEPDLVIPDDAVDDGRDDLDDDSEGDDDVAHGYCCGCGETFDPRDIDSAGFCGDCADGDRVCALKAGWELRRLNAIRGGWERR